LFQTESLGRNKVYIWSNVTYLLGSVGCENLW